ncbi:MAG: secretin N-terminal domain-containing protein [Planctomycetaceae bacterium]
MPRQVPANVQTLPLERSDDGEIDITDHSDGQLSLSVRDAPLREVLAVLAQSQGFSILMTDGVDARITGTFTGISFQEAMDSIFSLTDATWTQRRNVILVTKLGSDATASGEAQGRIVKVFGLNFVSAADVEKVVSTLLSPSGKIAINEVSNQDSNKTREQVIVEDLPQYIERVERYVKEIDVPPQQVMIDAHILQVELKNDSAHGVDFARLGEISGVPISISTPGFNGTVTDLSTLAPASYSIGLLDGDKSSALIQCLKQTTDAKTLASPKVMALNGQEAKVQIGEKLGYFVTTSTDTASLQSVEFLETGVVLKVTPRITEDGQILMHVMPEVSDGSVDALGLPSERTTEVSTTLMLADGMGMVVGGLITETDVETQQRLPVLGSLWGVGRFFRHKQVKRERTEIIIALVPHIVQCACPLDVDSQFDRATTRLLQGPLEKMPRPWEPALPDSDLNPRKANRRRIVDDALEFDVPNRPRHYFPTNTELNYGHAGFAR